VHHAPPETPAPYPHPACLPDAVLLKSCVVGTGRTGGPGGQNRNRVETLVTIEHTPTGLVAHASERRSQIENKHVAVRRLREKLAIELRTQPPKGRGLAALDEPPGSALWRSRVRGGRIACNPAHADYPALLAEALDMIADCGWEPQRAGVMLGVTASQLIKLVKDLPAAMIAWNRERAALGLHTLK
jgi:hypothetical protein